MPAARVIALLLVAACLCAPQGAGALDNGLARTPPMGWMSWAKFECEIDCLRHPFTCINEQLYMEMGDRLANDGYLDAGYEYIHIDDCWMEHTRDARGQLVANVSRFPSGIPALADYLHRQGLKFGIYEDFGTLTCAGYPGSMDHLRVDAQTFAAWRVDYLKLDGCYSNATQMRSGYPHMSVELNATQRPIVYSCSWPAYLVFNNVSVDYALIGRYCNLWRNYDDVARSWESVKGIIDYYNAHGAVLRAAQGPGRWNDPDMILAGNTELTVEQARAQLTVWAIFSAPLIMSNDLRTITPDYKSLLLNKAVIGVDQDPMGLMGRLVYNDSVAYVYVKEVVPVDTERKLFSYAVAVLNHANHSIHFATDLQSIGLTHADGYDLVDLWSGQKLGRYTPRTVYRATLAPTSAIMLKAQLPGLQSAAVGDKAIGRMAKLAKMTDLGF